MKKSWINDLDPQAEKDMRGVFITSLLLRQRLSELLSKKIDASNAANRSKNAYENPNWALVQADQRGYERAMHEIIELIK